MTEKRFIMIQNGNFHTVRDTVEKKPLGMFEFKEDEFPVYFCFHKIIDLLNELNDENEQLKQREERLLYEIEDFEELLDDKISFLYKAQADMINIDDYRYGQIAFAIQCLRELRKELQE